MHHLNSEALARLIDNPAGRDEAAHLESCAECSGELEELKTNREALAMLPDPDPPADAWAGIRDRLNDPGVQSGDEGAGRIPVAESVDEGASQIPDAAAGDEGAGQIPGEAADDEGDRRIRRAAWFRRAASIALFLAGGASGFALRGVSEGTPSPDSDRSVAAPSEMSLIGAGPLASREARAAMIDAALDGIDSPTEAALAVDRAGVIYQAALTRYGQIAGRPPARDYMTRLVTLQGIVLTTRQALREAPADPVINGYHLAAAAQRDAMIRRLRRVESQRPWF